MVKRSVALFCGLVLVAGIMGAPGLARADWDEGDPAMWVQLPDLTKTVNDNINITNGVDVKGYLADDFQCTGTTPITGIHIWGSFSDDVLPSNISFQFQIFSNNPGVPYSNPGDFLWISKEFHPGAYSSRLYTPVEPKEYFWDPLEREFSYDTKVYQFNFSFDPAEAFVPQADTIYWLLLGTPSDTFGWKTCNPESDDLLADAVWYYPGGEGDPGRWEQLVYFSGHPYEKYGGMNMAFVLTPIPGAFWLLGTGLLGLAGMGWRRKSSRTRTYPTNRDKA